MAACHRAGLLGLPGVRQQSPGCPVFLVLPARCFEGKLLHTACLVLGAAWDGHMEGQRTAKEQAWPVLPEDHVSGQGISGLLHRAEINSGKCITLCNSQRASMGCRRGAVPSAGTICQPRMCSGTRRPCIARDLGLHSKVK